MDRKTEKLLQLCPYLKTLDDLQEPIKRMEKAFVMNGGELTNDNVENAINYLEDLDSLSLF